MKEEAFRQVHQYMDPVPVLIFHHTEETTCAVDAHWHDDLEISLLYKGLVRYYVGGRTKDLTEGRLVLVNSGEVHSMMPLFNGKDESAPGITLMIRHDFLTGVIPHYDQLMFTDPQGEAETQVTGLLLEIAALDHEQGNGKAGVKILGLACQILSVLLDTCAFERSSVDSNDWKDADRQKMILDF